MSILGRISGSLPFRGQRGGAPAPTPASDKKGPPPGPPPIQRPASKPAGAPASDKKGPPPGPPPIQRPAGKPASAPASDKKGPPPGPPPIQRPSDKKTTPSGDKPKPPAPPVRTKPTGGPPPISTKSQADKDKEAIQAKITSARMTGDQLRMSGGERSADTHYRKADEMERRLKQGAPQLSDEAMSKIRPSEHLRDKPGSGGLKY